MVYLLVLVCDLNMTSFQVCLWKQWNSFSVFLLFLSPIHRWYFCQRQMASGRREMIKSFENPISGVHLLNHWWLRHPGNIHLNGCAWEVPLFNSSREKLLPVSKTWNWERNAKSLSHLEFCNGGTLGLEGMFIPCLHLASSWWHSGLGQELGFKLTDLMKVQPRLAHEWDAQGLSSDQPINYYYHCW